MEPETWLVKWRLLGSPDRVPYELLCTAPMRVFERLQETIEEGEVPQLHAYVQRRSKRMRCELRWQGYGRVKWTIHVFVPVDGTVTMPVFKFHGDPAYYDIYEEATADTLEEILAALRRIVEEIGDG